jgi:predicted permease
MTALASPAVAASARAAAGNLAFGAAFTPVILAVFLGLCAAWWKFSLPDGRLGRRRWRILLRLTGAMGLVLLVIGLAVNRGQDVAAITLRPLQILIPFAAVLVGSAVLALLPWGCGATGDQEPTPQLGVGLDLAQQQPPAPKRGGFARARALLANAYAWLIVAAVAYIGIRWVLRHL